MFHTYIDIYIYIYIYIYLFIFVYLQLSVFLPLALRGITPERRLSPAAGAFRKGVKPSRHQGVSCH